MLLARLFCGALLLFGAGMNAADDQRPSRIVSANGRYSVAFPDGWWVWNRAEFPAFFNYPADQAPPGGALPVGGAEITLSFCREDAPPKEADWLPSCYPPSRTAREAERDPVAWSGNRFRGP